jgi:hypothetical protein
MYLSPSELEKLPFWQYELILDDIEELNQKEKDEQENADKSGYKLPNGMKMPSAKDIQSGRFAQKSLPNVQMPKMPKI